jgi:hypothetical protein
MNKVSPFFSRCLFLAAGLFAAMFVNSAHAGTIMTSNSGLDGLNSVYGYNLTIADDVIDVNKFNFTLLNNSSLTTSPEALIDAFAFNLRDPDPLSTEIAFSNFSDNWTVAIASGGVQGCMSGFAGTFVCSQASIGDFQNCR